MAEAGPSENRGKGLAVNTIVLSIGQFLPKLTSFITLPILTGRLTLEEYGTYDLILTVVSLLLPAFTLQISTAVFRFLIDVRDKPDSISEIVSTAYCFIAVTSIVVLVAYWFLLPKSSCLITVLICLYYFVDIISAATLQCSRGLGQNVKYSFSSIVSALLRLMLTVVLVLWLEMALMGAVATLLFADLISTAYLFTSTHIYRYVAIKHFRFELLRDMVSYSWPMVPNSFAMWIMRLSNRLVITAVMGVSANAVFAVAYKIPQILSLAQGAFTLAWQENASLNSSTADASEYYSRMFKIVSKLMAGVMCLILAFAPLLFALLIQGDYDEAYIHIPILLLAMFFYSLSTYLGGIYVAYKKTRSIGVTTVVAAAVNLIINIIGIGAFGLYAASGAMLISFMLLCFYRMRHVTKISRLTYDFHELFGIILLLVGLCVLSMLQSSIADRVVLMAGIAAFFVLDWKLVRKILAISKSAILEKMGASRKKKF